MTSEIEERAKAFFRDNPDVLTVVWQDPDFTESELEHYCRISAAFHLSELARRDDRLRDAEEIVDRILDDLTWMVDACEIDRDAGNQATAIISESHEYRRKYPREGNKCQVGTIEAMTKQS